MYSEHSDQGLHYLPFSTVWSGSTLLAILSSLIKVCTVILSNLIRVYTSCHSQPPDQIQGPLSFSGTIWTGSTLFAILNSLIWVDTICHSQSDQGLQYVPYSVVWSYILTTSLVAVLWRSTLFAILSNLIKVYTICHSQQSDQGLHCHSQQSDQGLHYLPFAAVWSKLFAILSLVRVYTICHSQQSDQGLHYLPGSAVAQW